MGYTKLFGSIIHSTIWREENHVRIVWITMLAMTDEDGIVETSVPGLADAARVTLPQCIDALERFKSPDKYSRNPDNEGRRIREIRGGFEILNFFEYRNKMSAEDRRKKNAQKQQRWRDRQCQSVTDRNPALPSVTDRNPALPSVTEITTPEHNRSDQNNSDHNNSEHIDTKEERSSKKEATHSQTNIIVTRGKPVRPKTDGSKVWESYSTAYERRYGVKPIRNAKTNSLCSRLVGLVGADVAPSVADYYLTSRNAWYIQKGHNLESLVADAGKLHTEWLTGRRITQTKAIEDDRLQEAGDMWQRVIDKYGE